jgi:hypothetical protein
VPGNHETINYLQNLIDTGKYDLFSTIKITCEDAASLLKLYIRKLPVPIISREIDAKFTTEIIRDDGGMNI